MEGYGPPTEACPHSTRGDRDIFTVCQADDIHDFMGAGRLDDRFGTMGESDGFIPRIGVPRFFIGEYSSRS